MTTQQAQNNQVLIKTGLRTVRNYFTGEIIMNKENRNGGDAVAHLHALRETIELIEQKIEGVE